MARRAGHLIGVERVAQRAPHHEEGWAMSKTWRAVALLLSAAAALIVSASLLAQGRLTVIISGGFNAAYREALPEFEKTTGIKVATTMGFSQGDGDTIAKQLARGVPADVVILAKEGLADISPAKIVADTKVDLAETPTGVSVRAGMPRPDISTVEAFKKMLHEAKMVAIPPSTVGLHLKAMLYPQLGMAEEMKAKTTTDNGAIGRGEADIAIRAVSELLNIKGAEYVGTIPKEIQFISVFSAAVVTGASEPENARRLIAFLKSDKAAPAIRKSGMEPIKTRELAVKK
jgi:molybdate transport system substrate-binding protein